jgi:poly(3-hydroxybutyrate) depolymerase
MPRRPKSMPAAVLAIALCAPAVAAERLPALGATSGGVSVSGVSAGGYMAVQFHIAHSLRVDGAGILAAGPYYCAQGSAWAARYNCMTPGAWTPLPDPAVLQAATRALASAGHIDPVAGLRADRVWLFSGSRDTVVRREVTEALRNYYTALLPHSQVAFVADVAAGHAMVTLDYGSACGSSARPWLNDCDFDAAGALLAHVLRPLHPPSDRHAGRLLTFDQREFAPAAHAASMDDWGFAYVPEACRSGGCRVHVAFHGCQQGREAVGDAFAVHAGYNRWADTNRIVVLYPQAIRRKGWGPWPWPTSFVWNPNGCWDWWGYTGPAYHTRYGVQMRAVEAMLGRLSQAEPGR